MYNIYIKKLSRNSSAIRDAYIALGGNTGNVAGSMKQALSLLAEPPIIQVVAMSPIYRTAPVGGPSGQTDYLNAVVHVTTSLTPRELLERCLKVEGQLGRIRMERWGPRTIDLDLLLVGDEGINEPGLTLPHPFMRERLFVLVPLSDVAPPHLCLPPDEMCLDDALKAALTAFRTSLSDFRKKIIFGGTIFGTIETP